MGRKFYHFGRILQESLCGLFTVILNYTNLMYGDETRFEKFLYLGCYVGVLEMVLERLRVLLHLLEDAAHGGVTEDGLHVGVSHGAFADLGRKLIVMVILPNCLINVPGLKGYIKKISTVVHASLVRSFIFILSNSVLGLDEFSKKRFIDVMIKFFPFVY